MALLPILSAIATIAPKVGKLFSGASAGRADGRQAEIDVINDRDRAALDRSRLESDNAFKGANLDLDRREYVDDSRTAGYKDRMTGGLLQGLQDFQVTPPPGVNVGQISGGLRPSAMVGKEALGAQMSRDAIVRGLEGPNFSPVNPSVAGQSALPQAGKLDKLLNIASFIANLAGTAGEVAGGINGARGGGATPNPARSNASRIINSGRVRF